jgi:hypothetical protein
MSAFTPKTMDITEIRNMIDILTEQLQENEAQQEQYKHEIRLIQENGGEIKNIIITNIRNKLLRRIDRSYNSIFEDYEIKNPKLKNELMKEAYDFLDCNLPELAKKVETSLAEFGISTSELLAALQELLLFVLNNVFEFFKSKYKDATNSPYCKNLFLLINLFIVTVLFMGDCINPQLQKLLENIPYIGVIFKFIFCFRNQFYQLFKCQIYIRGLITIIDTFPFTQNFKDYIKRELSKFMQSFASKADAAADATSEKMAETVAISHFNACRLGPGILRDLINAMVAGMGFRDEDDASSSGKSSSGKSSSGKSSSGEITLYSDTPFISGIHGSVKSDTSDYYTIDANEVLSVSNPLTGIKEYVDSILYESKICSSNTSSDTSFYTAKSQPFGSDYTKNPKTPLKWGKIDRSFTEPPPSSNRGATVSSTKRSISQDDIPDPNPDLNKETLEYLNSNKFKNPRIGGKRRTKRRNSRRTKRRLKRRSNRKRRISSKR